MTVANLKYLTVLLDSDSPSFCYYKNYFDGKNERMITTVFEKAIKFSQDNGLIVNVIKSNRELPSKYMSSLKMINFIIVEPLERSKEYSSSIKVLDLGNYANQSNLSSICQDSIVIIRLYVSEIGRLFTVIESLIFRTLRINVIIIDIENMEDFHFSEYKNQLEKISNMIVNVYERGQKSFSELKFLTDRLHLKRMNNCNAGIEHITIAPNGFFYLCPGFYYQDSFNSIGDIEGGLNIKNAELLTLEKSPICNICDSYHCNRCVFINKRLTNEINTPSSQQCLLSHIERNASQKLLSVLHQKGFCEEIPDMPPIDYCDPYDVLVAKGKILYK